MAPSFTRTSSVTCDTQRAHGVVELWVADLEPEDRVQETLLGHLAADERERASRFVSARHRRRFVAARAFLRLLLADQLGASAATVRFGTGAHGKPSLAWPVADLQFNLAHSQALGVCAIARGTDQIGVDVEQVRAMDDLEGVARAALSPRELERYDALELPGRLRAFYDAWTRKEALLKAWGHGLSRSPRDIEVGFGPACCAEVYGGESPGVWLHAFEPRPGYVGALAAAGPPRAVRLRDWTWE